MFNLTINVNMLINTKNGEHKNKTIFFWKSNFPLLIAFFKSLWNSE